MTPERMLTAAGLAERLGVSAWQVCDLARRRLIPFHRFGRRLYFVESDVRAATFVAVVSVAKPERRRSRVVEQPEHQVDRLPEADWSTRRR